MFESHSQAIHELLRDRELVRPDELAALEEEHRVTGEPLADLAVNRGLISRPALLQRIAAALGYRWVEQIPPTLPTEVLTVVSGRIAHDYGVLPLRAAPHAVELLAVDPFNSQIVPDLAFALGREVQLAVSDPAHIEARINQYYAGGDAGLAELLQESGQAEPDAIATATLSADDLTALADQPPVVRFVNRVLSQAIRDQASDIHFEPFEHEFKIRCRVDGALQELPPPAKALALPVTSRLKVLADLNIAERRVPQDGRIKLTVGGHPIDLRVSTLPTQFGESVVLRVLDRSAVHLDLAQLGMTDEVLRGVTETVRRPNGIFVVTGPTGSGKTTTLYSALRAINTPELKLLTAEDPVEYEIEGIMQVPVNPTIGLTFASALRSFLRQDPDVIMVGEIRDLETAQTAIHAALTGHLVLSTLHTNDAAGAITRLTDLGVEPFLLASTLEGVLAQRLVRCVCPRCRSERSAPPELLEQLGAGVAPITSPLYAARGCPECSHTGYRGRRGLFEWLPVTEAMRDLIVAAAPTQTMRRQAVTEGMRTLRDDGIRAVQSGATTVEEVLKYT